MTKVWAMFPTASQTKLLLENDLWLQSCAMRKSAQHMRPETAQ